MRGRFDIVCVFKDGAYVRFTSKKERNLSATELLAALREYAEAIENGIKAEGKTNGTEDLRRP